MSVQRNNWHQTTGASIVNALIFQKRKFNEENCTQFCLIKKKGIAFSDYWIWKFALKIVARSSLRDQQIITSVETFSKLALNSFAFRIENGLTQLWNRAFFLLGYDMF